MKSWKTTVTGVLTIVVALASAAKMMFDSDPATNPDIPTVITAITAGIGLITARDNNVSSEQAGVK